MPSALDDRAGALLHGRGGARAADVPTPLALGIGEGAAMLRRLARGERRKNVGARGTECVFSRTDRRDRSSSPERNPTMNRTMLRSARRPAGRHSAVLSAAL
ncbi:MAG: hypothetical protein KDA25_06875, partial [Phycisphaerales bacterium]|nr:hypothetical protein [Phycisphaerales bacterium]